MLSILLSNIYYRWAEWRGQAADFTVTLDRVNRENR